METNPNNPNPNNPNPNSIQKIEIPDRIENIPIEQIIADDSFNCRGVITPLDVVELANDLKQQGQITPIVVHKKGVMYYLISGFRRLNAMKLNGEETIKATVLENINETTLQFLNLKENVQRQDLNIMAEAVAMKRILESTNMSHQDLGVQLSKSKLWVTTRIHLLQLPVDIQLDAREGKLNTEVVNNCYKMIKTNCSQEDIYEYIRNYKDWASGFKKGHSPPRPKVGRIGTDSASSPKRARKKAEIEHLIMMMAETFGDGIYLKSAAWCAGFISDDDMLTAIEDYAIALDLTFKRPENNLI